MEQSRNCEWVDYGKEENMFLAIGGIFWIVMLFITAPIWILPYLLYKWVKNKVIKEDTFLKTSKKYDPNKEEEWEGIRGVNKVYKREIHERTYEEVYNRNKMESNSFWQNVVFVSGEFIKLFFKKTDEKMKN